MRDRIEKKLKELELELPRPQKPSVAKILPYSFSGSLLFISGQLPQWEGDVRFVGKLGVDLDLEQGKEAARLSALNVLAQAKAALGGDLDRISRIVKVSGFVNCSPDFAQVAEVVNGASELFLHVLGGQGAHARVAVGAASMPFGVAVEIEAIMEVLT